MPESNIFFEIPCLTEKSVLLDGIRLQKKWFKAADKRIMSQYLQKFISYNSKYFDFLGVEPFIVGTDLNTSIAFRSNDYIGTIPLRASDTGKQIGDFVVVPRYIGKGRYSDYIDLLNLLKSDIQPEYIHSIPLASKRNFSPPLYMEALKFLEALRELLSINWKKFDQAVLGLHTPTGNINWNKYANDSYKVEKRIYYPTTVNILTEKHTEYGQIKFVYEICKKELLSFNTPMHLKHRIKDVIGVIDHKLDHIKPLETNEIIIKQSDNPQIKHCKKIANNILNQNYVSNTAWRVNYSDVFEKFVQYVFAEAAKRTGAKTYNNFKFSRQKKLPFPWTLKHLEPDLIYKKGEATIIIDAKYKSHLYNKFSNSDVLKSDYRNDLHQILAYSSFSNTQEKHCILCYPFQNIEFNETSYINPLNNSNSKIIILGMPLDKSETKNIVLKLTNELHQIEKRASLQKTL